jgi:arsenate reductase-like glutaredoxin family protein
VRDIFKQPLDEAEIRELARLAGGAAAIFSWRSPSARSLALNPKTAAEDELVGLMAREARLLRRPLVTIGERVLPGADPQSLAAAFGEPGG